MFLLYITTANKKEAIAIARTIITEHLAACANIIEPVTSLYWWEGKVQESTEVLLLAKTSKDLVNPAITRIKQLHSYECPCITAIAVDQADKDFTKWLETSIKLS